MNQHSLKIKKGVEKLGMMYGVESVWKDFVELTALSIHNSSQPGNEAWGKNELRYHEIIKSYTKEEVTELAGFLGALVLALEEDGVADVLGEIYQSLEINKGGLGQFFTPQHVCELMARMVSGDMTSIIERDGFYTVSDPACGSGNLIIAHAKVAAEEGINYQKHLVAHACDIDKTAFHMTYTQLSLLGIPAVVQWGDSLAVNIHEEWKTLFLVKEYDNIVVDFLKTVAA